MLATKDTAGTWMPRNVALSLRSIGGDRACVRSVGFLGGIIAPTGLNWCGVLRSAGMIHRLRGRHVMRRGAGPVGGASCSPRSLFTTGCATI